MQYLVLTSRVDDNLYGDTTETYSFPKQYRRHFELLEQGERIFAVVYEPRRGGGSQKYIGWAEIADPPVRDTANLQWWMVRYVDGIHPFPHKVPRLVGGKALETFLVGEALTVHSRLLQNRSVRPLEPSDLNRILELAGMTSPGTVVAEARGTDTPSPFERERREQVVSALIRDRRFQRSILQAYGYRCAVSGFGYTSPAEFSSGRLVEAAHIRPVGAGHGGDDSVGNGIALTPSLHGLFDAGLFGLRYVGTSLVLEVSPLLERVHLGTRETFSHLTLREGLEVALPENPAERPDPTHMTYHLKNVFKAR